MEDLVILLETVLENKEIIDHQEIIVMLNVTIVKVSVILLEIVLENRKIEMKDHQEITVISNVTTVKEQDILLETVQIKLIDNSLF